MVRYAVYGVQQEARQQALAAQQAAKAAELAARRAIVIAAAERAHLAMHEAAATRLSRDIAVMQDTAAKDAARAEAKRLRMREELDRSGPLLGYAASAIVLTCAQGFAAVVPHQVHMHVHMVSRFMDAVMQELAGSAGQQGAGARRGHGSRQEGGRAARRAPDSPEEPGCGPLWCSQHARAATLLLASMSVLTVAPLSMTGPSLSQKTGLWWICTLCRPQIP